MATDNKIGLVLAGGGAKGAYQIGAFEAMKELGLYEKIGPVSGTSIGGINLALYSSVDPIKAKVIWKSFKGSEFLALDDNGFDIFKKGDGIFSRDALLKILDMNVDYDKITNASYNYYVTVCEHEYVDEAGGTKDISHVRYIKLNGMDKDTIRQYLMATSAIPVVYDNVIIDGKHYSDGGPKDNTPILPISKEDVEDIIVISNDHNRSMTADVDKYPKKRIINIVPSADLNMDSLEGTVDLFSKNAIYRLKLGYLDAKMILGAYINGTNVPNLSGNANFATKELRMAELEGRANTTMNNLNDMLKRYGIQQ